jgi:spermidine/putrescine transport system substrate-binding protein
MKKLAVSSIAIAALFAGSLYAGNGTLRLITWKGYAPKALVKKFEKETGIKVKVTYSNNEEMIAKLRATRGGGFDLAQPSVDRISFVQKKFHIYHPIDYSKVNTKQITASMVAAAKRISKVDGKVYAVPHVYGTTGLIINKKMAPGANDWSDLWNPKYAGHISYRLKRPILIGAAFGMGYNPFALYGDKAAYQKLIDKVTKKLIESKKLVKTYWTSGDTQKAVVRSGDVWVESGWDAIGWQVHNKNKNIDFVCPKSGALGWIDTFAIPAKSKNIEAAYKWINFILQPKNAAVVTNASSYMTTSKDAVKYLSDKIKTDYARSYSQKDIDNIKWYAALPSGFAEIEAKALDTIKAAQ